MSTDRTRNVMLRLTPDEYERLLAAHARAFVTEGYRLRLPFAAWVRRTLLNVIPDHPPLPDKARKGPAKAKRR